LALCLEQGKGVLKDSNLSLEIFRNSANQGNVFAEYNLEQSFNSRLEMRIYKIV